MLLLLTLGHSNSIMSLKTHYLIISYYTGTSQEHNKMQFDKISFPGKPIFSKLVLRCQRAISYNIQAIFFSFL